MNEKTQSRVFLAIALLLLALSSIVLAAGVYMYFNLGRLGSELPVRTVSQFKNIANLMPLVSELSSGVDGIQSGNRRIDRENLRYTINKLQVAQGLVQAEFTGLLPQDVLLILDELNLLEQDVSRASLGNSQMTPTEAVLFKNRISYIYSELRDYVLRTNNDTLSVLQRQGGEISALKYVNISSALLYFIGALFCSFLLLSRRRILVELEASRKIALQSSAAKSEFLSNMSHEIRTPMNAIIGLSYLALKTALTPGQRDYVKRIQASGQHLLGIINDILDFSKIEAGKLSMERVPFDLEKVLDNVANLTAEKASSKGLELIFDMGQEVPRHLLGDPLRLGQVLVNLANNAVKFTDSGEVGIKVRVREETEGEALIGFEVSDTGVGITEEQKKLLFRSFQQADSSITRRYGGTGLGLAISKRLAEMMDGGLSVESEPGKGSVFTFTARVGKAEASETIRAPYPSLKGRRALVVDDNEHARAVITDMLESIGFLPSSAPSGPVGLEMVAKASCEGTPFDLILVDWQMPGMDGMETAERIKGICAPSVPGIILITAYGREEVIKAAEERGIGDVLIKPLSPSILCDAAMHLLRAERREAPVAPETEAPTGIECVRILLVEDNEENRQVALEILRAAGGFVDIARDGKEALDKVKEIRYDIVLMDMQMPVMDGLAATREIRSDPRFAKLPIVAMTANAMKEDRDRCAAAGMDDYVAKPIDPEALYETIRRYAKSERPASPARNLPAAGSPGIPEIEGIDVETGVKRVMGNERLYVDLLKRFSEGQRETPSRIRKAVADGDIALAVRLAHTLKGVAGNIGAGRVQESAGAMEASLDGRPVTGEGPDPLGELERSLMATICRIDVALASLAAPEPQAAAEAPSEARMIGIVGELADYVRGNDVEALDFFESARRDFSAALGPGELALIESALRAFDFKGAGAILEAVRARKGEKA